MIGKLLFLAAGLLIGLLLARFLRGGGRRDLTAPPPARPPMPRIGEARIDDARIDDEEIRELIRQNRKIEAIKRLRDQTGLGLKEAKDAVEAIEARMPR
ncbi:ribosomal protein L7/L12 [Sphingopyxis macrogoltabida]|uniref:Large ribosomal subunit protein bL12 C-terminal domain-containing protein n=1 Tax=Sphingopyxis macrogoltabida TaxID=33050 RepID=A0AAC8YZN1_SPHMC|nr:ribosomal protein L7/L12 [Sphingopyxis macrogoltabida]ALJ13370.1 hypothetical protein LH19_10875 [Sphingopyxis macrogoltabida]AMU89166.1 hypothetical protein ATM17_08960 [Sphingopyxis macrogoltabida]